MNIVCLRNKLSSSESQQNNLSNTISGAGSQLQYLDSRISENFSNMFYTSQQNVFCRTVDIKVKFSLVHYYQNTTCKWMPKYQLQNLSRILAKKNMNLIKYLGVSAEFHQIHLNINVNWCQTLYGNGSLVVWCI